MLINHTHNVTSHESMRREIPNCVSLRQREKYVGTGCNRMTSKPLQNRSRKDRISEVSFVHWTRTHLK